MCDSGKAFSDKYELTPVSVYSALDDWAGNGTQSVWYSCKNYRINVYCDGENVWIRDVHKFDETIRDNYLDVPCKEHAILYETLSIVDGLKNAHENNMVGVFLTKGKITNTKQEGQEFVICIEGEGKHFQMRITEEDYTFKIDEQAATQKAECFVRAAIIQLFLLECSRISDQKTHFRYLSIHTGIDFDAATAIGFLRQYGLDKDFKMNIEANHATLAGHTFQHELRVSAINGMLGSIDANQGDYLLGWDTDEFPSNVYEATLCMYEVLKAGGLTGR